MSKISIHHRSLQHLLQINSHEDFHSYLIEHAVKRYQSMQDRRGRDLGSVLAVCANHREALSLRKFPFKQILLTGINEPSEQLRRMLEREPNIYYENQNCENISLSSRSFDLVFCKEGLHHLARPVLGLYEMLRVCKQGAIIIEGYDTVLGRIFEILNLSSKYESNQQGNINCRDNYVFRWTKRYLQLILNSYYLESGYELEITLGWLSGRYSLHRSKIVRRLAALGGFAAGFVPGSYGNAMTALVSPGSDIPEDPYPADKV